MKQLHWLLLAAGISLSGAAQAHEYGHYGHGYGHGGVGFYFGVPGPYYPYYSYPYPYYPYQIGRASCRERVLRLV